MCLFLALTHVALIADLLQRTILCSHHVYAHYYRRSQAKLCVPCMLAAIAPTHTYTRLHIHTHFLLSLSRSIYLSLYLYLYGANAIVQNLHIAHCVRNG